MMSEQKALPHAPLRSVRGPQPNLPNKTLKSLNQNDGKKSTSANEGNIMKNQYIQSLNRVIWSDFLNRPVLIQKIRSVLGAEEGATEPLYLGEGVTEVMSSAAFEMMWRVVTRIGKAAETRKMPGDKNITIVKSETDSLRAMLKIKEETKPRELDNKIRVSMKDVLACRSKLPVRSMRRYEIRKIESEKQQQQ